MKQNKIDIETETFQMVAVHHTYMKRVERVVTVTVRTILEVLRTVTSDLEVNQETVEIHLVVAPRQHIVHA